MATLTATRCRNCGAALGSLRVCANCGAEWFPAATGEVGGELPRATPFKRRLERYVALPLVGIALALLAVGVNHVFWHPPMIVEESRNAGQTVYDRTLRAQLKIGEIFEAHGWTIDGVTFMDSPRPNLEDFMIIARAPASSRPEDEAELFRAMYQADIPIYSLTVYAMTLAPDGNTLLRRERIALPGERAAQVTNWKTADVASLLVRQPVSTAPAAGH